MPGMTLGNIDEEDPDLIFILVDVEGVRSPPECVFDDIAEVAVFHAALGEAIREYCGAWGLPLPEGFAGAREP